MIETHSGDKSDNTLTENRTDGRIELTIVPGRTLVDEPIEISTAEGTGE